MARASPLARIEESSSNRFAVRGSRFAVRSSRFPPSRSYGGRRALVGQQRDQHAEVTGDKIGADDQRFSRFRYSTPGGSGVKAARERPSNDYVGGHRHSQSAKRDPRLRTQII